MVYIDAEEGRRRRIEEVKKSGISKEVIEDKRNEAEETWKFYNQVCKMQAEQGKAVSVEYKEGPMIQQNADFKKMISILSMSRLKEEEYAYGKVGVMTNVEEVFEGMKRSLAGQEER